VIPWKWLIIDGWKSHGIPAYLQQTLLDDLSEREEQKGHGDLEFEAKDTTTCGIDMPGMVAMNRPWMTFQIDGLSIDIPCEDVLEFIEQLKAAPMRTWTKGTTEYVGSSYYKLHGFHKCIVLTPDLRAELLTQLESNLEEAEAQSKAFWADRKLPSQVLQEANAKAHGLEIDAYKNVDFGGHKHDRFQKLGKKGEA
jgi:hypothetical protein